MREIASIAAGMGILIGIYLVVKNYTGATKVMSGFTSFVTSTVSVLQGNSASGINLPSVNVG